MHLTTRRVTRTSRAVICQLHRGGLLVASTNGFSVASTSTFAIKSFSLWYQWATNTHAASRLSKGVLGPGKKKSPVQEKKIRYKTEKKQTKEKKKVGTNSPEYVLFKGKCVFWLCFSIACFNICNKSICSLISISSKHTLHPGTRMKEKKRQKKKKSPVYVLFRCVCIYGPAWEQIHNWWDL